MKQSGFAGQVRADWTGLDGLWCFAEGREPQSRPKRLARFAPEGAARHASRRLADSIASLDKQAAGLAQAFDPAEARRLEERLAARGGDDDQRDTREILNRQLAAVRSLEARIEDAKTHRARRFEMLKRPPSIVPGVNRSAAALFVSMGRATVSSDE